MIGLYSEGTGKALCILQGHEGGITHLKFSDDGLRLYSGGRKDSEILCWDLREPGKVLFSVPRHVNTHQRIYFDLSPNGEYLFTGKDYLRENVFPRVLVLLTLSFLLCMFQVLLMVMYLCGTQMVP